MTNNNMEKAFDALQAAQDHMVEIAEKFVESTKRLRVACVDLHIACWDGGKK